MHTRVQHDLEHTTPRSCQAATSRKAYLHAAVRTHPYYVEAAGITALRANNQASEVISSTFLNIAQHGYLLNTNRLGYCIPREISKYLHKYFDDDDDGVKASVDRSVDDQEYLIEPGGHDHACLVGRIATFTRKDLFHLRPPTSYLKFSGGPWDSYT